MESHGTLKKRAFDIYQQIKDRIRTPGAIAEIIGAYHDCVYIKKRDGTIVHSNLQYEKRFAGGCTAPGRNGASFLASDVAEVSFHSDELVSRRCSFIEFEHDGLIWAETSRKRVMAKLQTVKISVSELGFESLAILGVTCILKEEVSNAARRIRNLLSYHDQISEMKPSIQHCLRLLARGESVPRIAEGLGVSRRTVEKHRHDALDALGLNNVIELTQLLCRIQDAGLDDFGIFTIDEVPIGSVLP